MGNKEIVFQFIGAFIVSAIIMAIPILCTLSYVLLWYEGLRFLLTIGTALVYLWIYCEMLK